MLKTLNFFPVKNPHSFDFNGEEISVLPCDCASAVKSLAEINEFLEDTKIVISTYAKLWSIFDIPTADWEPMKNYFSKWGPLFPMESSESVRTLILACYNSDFLVRLLHAAKDTDTDARIVAFCDEIYYNVKTMMESHEYCEDQSIYLSFFPIADNWHWVISQEPFSREPKPYPQLRMAVLPHEINDIMNITSNPVFAASWLKQKLLVNFTEELSHLQAQVLPTILADHITFSLRIENNLYYFLLNFIETVSTSCRKCGEPLTGRQISFCSKKCKDAYRDLANPKRNIMAGVRYYDLTPEYHYEIDRLSDRLFLEGKSPEEVKAIVYREAAKLKQKVTTTGNRH